MDDSATVEESAASFLEMALHRIEEKANDTNINGQDKSDTGDHAESGHIYICFQQILISHN